MIPLEVSCGANVVMFGALPYVELNEQLCEVLKRFPENVLLSPFSGLSLILFDKTIDLFIGSIHW